jgi:hypothetical protein
MQAITRIVRYPFCDFAALVKDLPLNTSLVAVTRYDNPKQGS